MKLIYWRRDGHPTGSSAPAGPRRPLMLPQLHVWSAVEPAAAAHSFPAGRRAPLVTHVSEAICGLGLTRDAICLFILLTLLLHMGNKIFH